MKALPLIALVLIAVLVGAFALRRADHAASVHDDDAVTASAPACADPAACLPAPPARATPSVALPAPAPAAPDAGREPALSPPAADGAALRAEADRLLAERRIPEAIAVLRRAVEAAPTAENHGDLGALLYRLTAFREAARHLRAAAELDPENADRWIALANAQYRAVNPGEAWKAERRAREAEPGLELGRDRDGMRVRKPAP